ncbi:MAG: hypothetical protein SFU86_21620 [Pirellulaceae bacterium]|nr:hypothetical protein [Pirellulaceae bacterium]
MSSPITSSPLRMARHWLLLFWVALVALAASGCGGSVPPKVPALDGKRLGAISFAYQRASEKLGHPPTSIAELKPHLSLVGDPDELLVSPRDGQPYVIVWGVNLEAFEGPTPPVVAYEAGGAGGRRMVLNVMGISVLTDAEFAALNLTPPRVATSPSSGN